MININKAKIMTNVAQTPIRIEQEEIEYVAEYTYLGQIVALKNEDLTSVYRTRGKNFGNFATI